jgi:integrase/recombinase XerC
MLSTGLRTIEICRANICDIRQNEGNFYLYVQGKGRFDKSESVLIAPKVYKLIQTYLKVRGKVLKNSPLFVSTSRRNKNSRLDTQTIRKMIKSNLRAIGADSPTLSAHSLRHTAATVMIQHGEKLYNVQMVLRHKNLATTMIYNNAINRFNNRAEIDAAKILLI